MIVSSSRAGAVALPAIVEQQPEDTLVVEEDTLLAYLDHFAAVAAILLVCLELPVLEAL